MINALPKLIVRAAWAPIAVLVFHNLIARTSLRQPLDFFMHFLGGASMAFFLLTMLELFPMVFGAVSAVSGGIKVAGNRRFEVPFSSGAFSSDTSR